MTEYRVLDLFCGLGGFSQAFAESERWDVTTVDIEPDFEPDIRADVTFIRPGYFDDPYDVVLASPPCTVFSPAGNHDLWDMATQRPVAQPAKDHVALAHHTVGLIEGLAPEFWFLENPRGRMRWVLGQPTGTVTYCQYGKDYQKPTDLWGRHPPMDYKTCGKGGGCHTENLATDGTSAVASMDSDVAERSKVPYQLSESIRVSCEAALDTEQVGLARWADK